MTKDQLKATLDGVVTTDEADLRAAGHR